MELIAAGKLNGAKMSADSAPDSDDLISWRESPRAEDVEGRVPESPEASYCMGPGRNGEPLCGKPRESRRTSLCVSHRLQKTKNGSLQPLRTRTSKSTCVGPGQDGGLCGRRVTVRVVGQDDGICKTHHDQQKRSGILKPIERRMEPIPDTQCWGPGQDGNVRCDRLADARDTLLCSPHDRQHKKNPNVLQPIRRINTPDGPCEGPALDGSLCGRPIKDKTHRLCGGHYGQHNNGKPLTPLQVVRKRGVVARCKFPGCKYNDAPSGEGYCRHHWQQHANGSRLTSLKGNPNRGRAVLERDEEGNKLCSKCEVWKPIDQFTRANKSSDGLNHRCRHCHAAARVKAKYGITLEYYEAMLASQRGRCALCPYEALAGRRLAVDHDHTCCPGELSCGNCVRGLLCPNCNRGLGLFGDSSDTLRKAVLYIIMNKVDAAT